MPKITFRKSKTEVEMTQIRIMFSDIKAEIKFLKLVVITWAVATAFILIVTI